MDAPAFDTLVESLRHSRGLAAKADIGTVAARLGLQASAVPVGDDCAALPDGDGHLLFAIEGFLEAFVAGDPWFAGWCGVMVNLSDIAAMGGRALAVVDALWARDAAHGAAILDGMKAACAAYGVPIVGGHSNLKAGGENLAVAVLGRADHGLLTSFDAQPGDVLVAAIDHRGAYREPFDNWQAALAAPPARLRGDLALLPEIARRGLAHAAKDISQAGIVGTAIMLAECSRVGLAIDLAAVPVPAGVTLSRWLASFPSFGFLFAVPPAQVPDLCALFAARALTAAAIGSVTSGAAVAVRHGPHRAVVRDLAATSLMGLAPAGEAA